MSFVEETFGLGVLMSLVELTFLHPCLGNALPEKNAVQTEFRRGRGVSAQRVGFFNIGSGIGQNTG